MSICRRATSTPLLSRKKPATEPFAVASSKMRRHREHIRPSWRKPPNVCRLDNAELSLSAFCTALLYETLPAGRIWHRRFKHPSYYKPEDYSDVGQAEVLGKRFSANCAILRHTFYPLSILLAESEPGAQAVAHELTRRQLKEAGNDLVERSPK